MTEQQDRSTTLRHITKHTQLSAFKAKRAALRSHNASPNPKAYEASFQQQRAPQPDTDTGILDALAAHKSAEAPGLNGDAAAPPVPMQDQRIHQVWFCDATQVLRSCF